MFVCFIFFGGGGPRCCFLWGEGPFQFLHRQDEMASFGTPDLERCGEVLLKSWRQNLGQKDAQQMCFLEKSQTRKFCVVVIYIYVFFLVNFVCWCFFVATRDWLTIMVEIVRKDLNGKLYIYICIAIA